MLVNIVCEVCGKNFCKKSSEIKRTTHNFCSYECSHLGLKIVRIKTCPNCLKEFKVDGKDAKKVFCSHSCSATYSNKRRQSRKVDHGYTRCKYCGEEFHKSTSRQVSCSIECRTTKARNDKINEFLAGNLTDKQTRTSIIRNHVLEKQENKCAVCGCSPVHNDRPLVFVVDHINGVFTDNRPENIRAICPNCNSQTDTFSGKNTGKNIERRHNERIRD